MKKHPPIWVWLICAGLMFVLITYLQLTISGRTQLLRQQQYTVFKQQMESFTSNYQVDSNLCRVICWGSSITRQAIVNSDVMRSQIADYGKNIDVQKMYMLGANNHTFPYIYELFDATAKLKPSLICIEDNIFSHTKNIQHSKLEKEINYLLTNWGLKAPETRKLPEYEKKNFDTHDIRFDISQQKDTLNTPDIQRTVLTYADNKLLNEQLQFILEQQIPIAIINIPRVGTVQERLIKPEDQEAIDRQIAEYRAAGFQIEYWKYPDYLPFKYYSDFTHMNQAGRTIYSKWLSKKLAEKLASQCPS